MTKYFKIHADDDRIWEYIRTENNIVFGQMRLEMTGCWNECVNWCDKNGNIVFLNS